MISLALATGASIGTYLVLTAWSNGAPNGVEGSVASLLGKLRAQPTRLMDEAGIEGVSPLQFIASSVLVGLCTGLLGAAIFGFGASSLLIGGVAASIPAVTWKSRRTRRRDVAGEAWPRMIDELRVLTGAAGRSVPQALLEVGLRGPVELRGAFEAAQRDWALTTDFGRMVAILKDRLADPTADVIFETLLVAVEVGGDLDARLSALAEDRRQDESDRKDAAARQSGARFARMFVVIVPGGMALAGMNVGDGAASFRTASGQLLVSIGVALIVVCWLWASRVMRLPRPIRVFDR